MTGEKIKVWKGLFRSLFSWGLSYWEAACVTEELLLLGLNICLAEGLKEIC